MMKMSMTMLQLVKETLEIKRTKVNFQSALAPTDLQRLIAKRR